MSPAVLPSRLVTNQLRISESSIMQNPLSSSRVDISPRKINDLRSCGNRVVVLCNINGELRGGENLMVTSTISDFRVRIGSQKNVPNLRPARGIKINREPTPDKQGNGADEEDDSELCPVECVREFTSRREFEKILEHAKEENALVVVDFFKTACGSCRYIEKGFVKLCKGAGNNEVSVIFLKHNVMDEYEEQSEVAASLKIRVVPLFHFYKDGKLVDSFATREKSKILEAICKHTGLELQDMPIPSGV